MNQYDIVTKEFVLEKLAEEDIFFKYMGIEPQPNESYCNPFRDDSEPDCYFYRSNKNGVLYFKDFAAKIHWDCFNVVQELYNCSFKKALMIIANEFGLVEKEFNINLENSKYDIDELIKRKKLSILRANQYKKDFIYRVTSSKLRVRDLIYWQQFGITSETLAKFNVYRAEKVWIKSGDSKNFKVRSYYSNDDPCYVYDFKNYNYKFYYPLRKYNNLKKRDKKKYPRFLSTGPVIEGWNQLPVEGEYVIITKSYKDVMAMYEFGIPAIASPSESNYKIIEEALPELESRFTYVIVLMDWDRAGQAFSIYFRNNHRLRVFSFKSQTPKDFSDHVKYYGIEYMNDLINQQVSKYL